MRYRADNLCRRCSRCCPSGFQAAARHADYSAMEMHQMNRLGAGSRVDDSEAVAAGWPERRSPARAVPIRSQDQPRRLLLDGAGRRSGHAGGLIDHQRVERARHRDRGVVQRPACSGLTRDLAAQWTSRKGIRVNAVAPGFFASEMTEADPSGPRRPPRRLDPGQAAGRALPAELAAVIVFLASDASSYVSGVTLPVDGGLTIA